MLLNVFRTSICTKMQKPVVLLSVVISLVLVAWSSVSVQADQPDQSAAPAISSGPQPKLNSVRIREKYGNYGIEVLDADEQVRVSNLYSVSNGQKITRTLAIVLFPESIPRAILGEHEMIVAGGSIGEVFKSQGWQVDKENLYLGEIAASADFEGVYNMMGGVKPTDLAVHAYELSVHRKLEQENYALIIEVHHPDYLDLLALEEVYSDEPADMNPGESSSLPGLEIVREALSSY